MHRQESSRKNLSMTKDAERLRMRARPLKAPVKALFEIQLQRTVLVTAATIEAIGSGQLGYKRRET
jgi:hypothetical protein